MSAILAKFSLLLSLITGGLVSLALLVFVASQGLPGDDIQEVPLEEPLRVYAADGALIAHFGTKRRLPIDYANIPPDVVNAFLAAEDARFFDHIGVDPVGLARAAVHYLRTGTRTQGGSTITMQLARNVYLKPEKTFSRKVSEVLIALRLERTLSKQDILARYLNQIFFGHRAYGIAAASDVYYGKPVSELNLAQIAMLSAIPQAPSANNPVSNPSAARQRRDYVLGRMRALGFIDESAYTQALSFHDDASLRDPEISVEADYVAEMVRLQVLELFPQEAYTLGLRVHTTIDRVLQGQANRSLRRALREYDLRHGYTGAESTHDVRGTSEEQLDTILQGVPEMADLQKAIVVSVSQNAAELYLGSGRRHTLTRSRALALRPFRSANRRGPMPSSLAAALSPGDVVRLFHEPDGELRLASKPRASAALVALSPHDGAIRALVGGYAFSASKFNRAVDAMRQPGSAFKPFLYAAAIANGYSALSIVDDGPVSIPDGAGGEWTPQNFGGGYMGEVRLHKALVRSLNVATVNLAQELGLETVRQFVPRFGIGLESVPDSPTLALGSGSVSPLLMARGFAVFANGGYLIDPYVIDRIEDAQGRVLFAAAPRRPCPDCSGYPHPPPHASPVVISPEVAYQVHNMLENVIEHGTGQRARSLGRHDIAGKTGTSSATRDSWFCGYHRDLVATVWIGTDDFKPLGAQEVGGRAALSLWVDFMGKALSDLPVSPIDPPEGFVTVYLNDKTEALTDPSDPEAVRLLVPADQEGDVAALPDHRYAPFAPDEVEFSSGPFLENDETLPSQAPNRLIDNIF